MANLQITIDDGPEPVSTALDTMLRELATRRVRAAFFVLGKEVRTSPDATGRIVVQGHVLGNHSWDHFEDDHRSHTSQFRPEEIFSQFQATHDEVLRVTGRAMQHWRAPRLENISAISAIIAQGRAGSAARRLYSMSHCDVHADSKDSQGATQASDMLSAIRHDIRQAGTRKDLRLLFHVKAPTANAFAQVLDGLVRDGHRLVDFEQLQ